MSCQLGEHCDPVFEYLVEVGHSPMIRAKDSCVIFDVDALAGKDLSFENKATVKRRCGVSSMERAVLARLYYAC